jgi:hypothetical protein
MMTVVEDGRLADVVLADVVDVETLQNDERWTDTPAVWPSIGNEPAGFNCNAASPEQAKPVCVVEIRSILDKTAKAIGFVM